MPLYSTQHLIHQPVYTKMGIRLGTLIDIECDSTDHTVIHFVVQQKGLFGAFKKPLLINQSQVVEVTEEKIIVEDTTTGEGAVA